MKEKKLTILDIARLAGVSKATVSRVLNNNPTVDEELRTRVMRVVKEHDFVPSINALGLNGRSQLLGILTPRYLWAALQEMTWGIADYINKETRYEIILYSCANEEEGYRKVLDQIVQTNLVAGLIATLHHQSPDHLLELYEQGLPVVLLDTIGIECALPTICADQYMGAYEGVNYLLELGHKRIAYINGVEEWNCSRDRYRGYCDALREAGLAPDPNLFFQGDYSPDAGIAAVRAFLNLPIEDRPTAIFATNDDMAYAAITTLQEAHLRVPDDISVLGFNDDPTTVVRTSLTTIHQPFTEMAHCAAELLVALAQPNHVFSHSWQELINQTLQPFTASALGDIQMPARIQFPTHLVERNTCRAISH